MLTSVYQSLPLSSSGVNAPLIDLDGPAQTNPIQPQFTSMQPQYTAVQPQYTSLQPQYTSYNPYLQQAQQEALQQEYARQQADFARQQMEAQSAAAAQQAQQLLLQHQHQQQQEQQQREREGQEQQPLVPQPTAFGSNNPFARAPSPPPSPTIPARPITSPPRDAPVPFTLTGTYEGGRPRAATARENERDRDRDWDREARDRAPLRPYSTGAEPTTRRHITGAGPSADEERDERLASVFAGYAGDGVDTFGNVGQLRCVFCFKCTPAFVFGVGGENAHAHAVADMAGRTLGGSRRRGPAPRARVRRRTRSCTRGRGRGSGGGLRRVGVLVRAVGT